MCKWAASHCTTSSRPHLNHVVRKSMDLIDLLLHLSNEGFHQQVFPLIHPSIHSLIHPSIHPLIYSLIHPSTHSLIHPFTHLLLAKFFSIIVIIIIIITSSLHHHLHHHHHFITISITIPSTMVAGLGLVQVSHDSLPRSTASRHSAVCE